LRGKKICTAIKKRKNQPQIKKNITCALGRKKFRALERRFGFNILDMGTAKTSQNIVEQREWG